MTTGWVKWRNRLLSLVVVLTLWEIAGRTIESLLLPTFTESIVAFARLVLTAELWQALWLSNQAMLIGYAGALVIGVPVGVLIGLIRAVGRIGSVYLTIMLMTPTSALIPLIMIAVGLNVAARAVVVFLFAVPFIVLNTQAGLKHIDPALIEMAQSFGATRWHIIRRIALPAALPDIMTGMRIGLGRAITGMVNVELLLSAVGLGRLLITYQARFQAGNVYALVLIILLEAVVLMRLARVLERREVPWMSRA